MHLDLTARPSNGQPAAQAAHQRMDEPPGRVRRPARVLLALLGALLATFALSAAPALANAGKILVFTGTAGTPNASSADAVTAITALGAANDFTVDSTDSAAQINAANLAGYRAVVFVNSAGDVLDAAGETALQDYVQTGGGYVGIGESALLEQGGAAFFNTLTGLSAARITGTGVSSTADVEFLDRVHPSTRALPLLGKGADRDLVHVGHEPHRHRRTRSPACAATRFRTARRSPTTPSAASPAATDDDPAAARAPGVLVPRPPAGPHLLHRARQLVREPRHR